MYQEASESIFAVPAPSACDAQLIPTGEGTLGDYAEFMRRQLDCAAVVVTIVQPFATLLEGGAPGEATAARLNVCATAPATGGPPPNPDKLVDPITAGDLGFGFYAGISLRLSSGHNLGTLAAVDVSPRTFSKNELANLMKLTNVFVELIEFHLATSEPNAGIAAKA